MITRIDRLQTALPPPSDPDPVGASVVQELLGGKFGEMSTFMNYTYQSFNFRSRQGARPFYDLVASIAAEEFGHIELVAAHDQHDADRGGRRQGRQGRGVSPASSGPATPSSSSPGVPARSVQDSMGKPWREYNVFSSGDLVEDLTHNFFLETGARNNKLKVYEMVDHPAARALTGYLLVRGGVPPSRLRTRIENLTGADMMKLFPSPKIPTDSIPECQPHIARGEHRRAVPLLAGRLPRTRSGLQRPAPGDRGKRSSWPMRSTPRVRRRTICRRRQRSSLPGPIRGEIAEIAATLRKAAGLPAKPSGVVANGSTPKTTGRASTTKAPQGKARSRR